MSREGITAPAGFKAAGIACGIKKQGAPDLALIVPHQPCTAAGVFTTNSVKAHPVIDAINKLESGSRVSGILINSGSANACTGPEGMSDLGEILSRLSREAGLPEEGLIMSSTGVIGERLPSRKIIGAIPDLVSSLSADGHENAARAIMTTDTRPKTCSLTIECAGGAVTVGGMAKGAGMINPNMATMLAFLTTDAVMNDARALRRMLKSAVDASFNRLDLDMDMSTNDSVFILAGGMSGIDPMRECPDDFEKGLLEVCTNLAGMIAADCEGATKLVTIDVMGAASAAEADKAARAVAESPLVKTAFYGADPNWGRIMAALGRSGAAFDPSKVSISVNGLTLVKNGVRNTAVTEKEAVKKMQSSEITLAIDLREGQGAARILSGDLTPEYIRINASYRS